MLKQLKSVQGSSLIELMIAMSLGVSALSAFSAFIGFGIGVNANLLTSSRLNEEFTVVTQLLARDIARAGFNGSASIQITDPLAATQPFLNSLNVGQYPDENAQSCILFAYDRNANGVLDTQNGNENYGYRLRSNAIEMRTNGAQCDAGGWHDLTDPNVVKVSKLQFSVQGHARHGINASRVKLLLEAELKHNGSISKRLTTSFMVKNHDPL